MSDGTAVRSGPTLVSVIIAAHHALDLIDVQLTALAAQDYAGAFEVIVSDNAANDGLESHILRHPLRADLRLRYVDSSDRRGPAHARNTGVSIAGGDLLAFCDHDDRVHPSWLTEMVRVATRHDAVGGAIETVSINSPEVAAWRPIPDPTKLCEVPGYFPIAYGCTLAVWSDVFQSIGGYNENFDAGGEDKDISWRIQREGFTLGYAPDAVVAYRLRGTYRGLWSQMRSYGQSDAKLYAEHRRYGLPRPTVLVQLNLIAGIVLLNPLVPKRIRRIPVGHWVMHVAALWGRIRGSVQYRVFYI
ncbi:glycosyltransferase [Rhodococcus sp. ABRD24]|uniref:glycosyltransferase n=1 Tax=Rhodococcus sp. ABRD24 TaxID=2507582 RepID=UPI00103903BF|nr:glycosyltransferase [Rhodococcus sp. ABRD24]QBJ97855.1 glycosyltransferase [Rhodococcus sp. ABRD24]